MPLFSLFFTFCFLFKIYFNWSIIALQYCVGFWHTSTWISQRYTYVPSLLNLPTTSHSILPLKVVAEHQGLNLPTADSHWLSNLHMVIYVFQCSSLSSPLPLLPLLGPQVCFLCLCLHCSPENRFISTIFLDSIYMCEYMMFVFLFLTYFTLYQFSSVAHLCPTLCDPMNCSTPGLPVHHQCPEFTQTHVRWVGDAIQPSHPLLSPSPPAPNPSQHQSLFQWVNSSHEVAKVLEFQL